MNIFNTIKRFIKPRQVVRIIKQGIQKSFSRHLLATNVITTFSIAATGDMIEQYYEIKVQEIQSWKKSRTWDVTCCGVVIGILCHHWYQALDRNLPVCKQKTVIKKTVIDQVVFLPTYIIILMSTFRILKGLNEYVDKGNDDKI
ncbi:Mpv17-like protein 2 [Armadillidium vulgare]|nr:Mpv17-like protein 2 [Armadillidium vulgare]